MTLSVLEKEKIITLVNGDHAGIIANEYEKWDKIKCPKCGTTGMMTSPRQFNLMFKTQVGPVEESGSTAYLRPETAQGIYVNYQLVQGSTRMKIPFGIAQIGKAFRNEIIARNFIFRTREFEQMEMQYFVKPGNDNEAMREWKEKRENFYTETLGINEKNIRFHEHVEGELAHYAKEAWDIEYNFPFGWSEVEGIHNRTDFDLARHEEYSGKNLKYFDFTYGNEPYKLIWSNKKITLYEFIEYNNFFGILYILLQNLLV